MSQCTAKAKSSGKRCAQNAIRGGNVCKVHGGSAPQVIRCARERLAALVDPSLAVFEQRLADGDAPALQVTVARDVLDRAGYKASDKLELSGPDGGAVRFDFSALSDEEFGHLAGLVARITASDRS